MEEMPLPGWLNLSLQFWSVSHRLSALQMAACVQGQACSAQQPTPLAPLIILLWRHIRHSKHLSMQLGNLLGDNLYLNNRQNMSIQPAIFIAFSRGLERGWKQLADRQRLSSHSGNQRQVKMFCMLLEAQVMMLEMTDQAPPCCTVQYLKSSRHCCYNGPAH